MRSRFRQLLRDWAARDVVITESGDGVAMEVNNANETGRVSQTGKPENPTLTAQPEDGSQLADCLELAGERRPNVRIGPGASRPTPTRVPRDGLLVRGGGSRSRY
ncbi:unnamed protein product [Ascophyllum nodosum]